MTRLPKIRWLALSCLALAGMAGWGAWLTAGDNLRLSHNVPGDSMPIVLYADSHVFHAGELLSSEALRGFLQKRLSLEKISDRIDEGMDATIKQTLIIGSKLKGTEQAEPEYAKNDRDEAVHPRT